MKENKAEQNRTGAFWQKYQSIKELEQLDQAI